MDKFFVRNSTFFNLTDFKPTPFQRLILGLGSKFLPKPFQTPIASISSLKQSLSRFVRSLRLALFFKENSSNITIPAVLDNNWIPEYNNLTDPLIDDYFIRVSKRIEQFNWSPSYSNLDYLFQHSIDKFLTVLHDKLVVSADKNLGSVLIFKKDYDKMVIDILSDTSTYSVIEDQSYINRGFALLRQILAENDKLYTYYNNTRKYTALARSLLQLQHENKNSLRTAARFYILIKMHKTPVLGRPIAASVNTMTYFASRYLHNILDPLVARIPTNCRNSNSIILDMENIGLLTNDSLLLAADVKSLYPSIPTEFGIKRVKFFLTERLFCVPDIDFYCALLHWILTNNYVIFNGVTYKQLTGTAMGTPVAVCYAIIVLYTMERELIPSFQYYRRYIDDIFAIIPSREEGERFVQQFQLICPNIVLDAVNIANSVIFLDLKLTLSLGHISTELYHKPINKFQYIPPTSSHPSKLLVSVIMQEIKRIRLACSTDHAFYFHLVNYRSRLRQRGYPDQILKPIFQHLPTRRNLLSELSNLSNSSANSLRKPVLVVQVPQFRHLVKLSKFFQLPPEITALSEFKKTFHSADIIIAKKNFPSLGLLLSREPRNILTPHSSKRGKYF